MEKETKINWEAHTMAANEVLNGWLKKKNRKP
jgi:hypothetical protein